MPDADIDCLRLDHGCELTYLERRVRWHVVLDLAGEERSIWQPGSHDVCRTLTGQQLSGRLKTSRTGSNLQIRRKLIEVALPLEAINIASAREKSIRHGHPSTLHLWWARRPLAAARAVIFAQMVDDPSAYVDVLRADPKLRRKAESALKARLKLWEEARALSEKAKGSGLQVPEPGPAPTLDDMLADQERQRLFRIIENLVLWENTTNETVLQAARDEIWQSWRRACAENADHPRAKELFDRKKLPAFHDPFAGGGALPLEAQRLGLESYASDLNPVAVLINKAMIEIPPRFAGKPPGEPRGAQRRLRAAEHGTVRAPQDWPRMFATTAIGCATKLRGESGTFIPRSKSARR